MRTERARRVADNTRWGEIEPGQFSLQTYFRPRRWWLRTPTAQLFSVVDCHVTEFGDGSITVCSPMYHDGVWFRLKRGDWTEVPDPVTLALA